MVPSGYRPSPGPRTKAPASDYTGATRPLERDAEARPHHSSNGPYAKAPT
jgi:hypothetical protein